MNILKIHDLVKFWIDEYQSPRQEDTEIDAAIWSAAKQMTEERYDASRLNHMGDTVDNSQRVRDELHTLTRKTDRVAQDAIEVDTDYRIDMADFPEDYKYLLALDISDSTKSGLDVILDDEWRVTEAVPVDWKRDWLKRNPYRKPKATGPFTRDYYEQYTTYMQLHTAGDPQYARITYLAEPVENYIGVERAAGFSVGSSAFVIALGDITYSGTDYVRGELVYMAVATTWTGANILTNFVNTDLPDTLHEELAKKAAILLLERVDLPQKAQQFQQEIMAK